MKLAPFEAAHLSLFEPQSEQAPYLDAMDSDVAALAASHFSMTGIANDGEIVGCAGILPYEGDLLAWAVFSERIVRYAKPVFQAVRAGLNMHAGQRILAHVAPEHTKAARFAEALDFTLAGRVLHPNGKELFLYARER